MTEIGIISVEPGTAEFRRVLQLHKTAKATLGFLPDSGFTERAVRGTLLAAIDDPGVAGYVLFDLTGDKVKVRHLCVDPPARGQGIARALVNELASQYTDRRCIELACRRDYGLAGMWKALGFHAVHDRPGRSTAGHRLTVWQLDFGHPTLFSSMPAVGELACLDQMVLEDLVVDRRQGQVSRYLLDDWVDELVELCVTDEVFAESEDTDDDDLRASLLAVASSHRNLSRPGSPWERLVPEVAAAVPAAGAGDHRHLARAIEGGALYFVTRDTKILRGASKLRKEHGLVILPPEGLLDQLDRERREDRYEPVVLEGTELTDELLPATEQDDYVAALLNHGEGERAHSLRATIRTALADPKHSEVRVVRDGSGQILAGVIRCRRGDALNIATLRVRWTSRLTDAVARQLAFQQRKTAADRGLGRVAIIDPVPQVAVVRALGAEGFDRNGSTWECQVVRGIHDAQDALSGRVSREECAAWERLRWPGKVVGGSLPTFMVSIEPAWAERLFDASLAGATLFARDPVLGLSREHVYYRAPGSSRALAGPARVVWYVKGGKVGHPEGHVRAVSHLVEVVCDRPRTLHSRFARLGVWSREHVEEAARRTGQAMALRLTDTELLERPLSLQEVRRIYSEAGESFNAPQGPITVDEHTFCLLYRGSSAYA